jgi:uncharacterized SAM-binding protein YcdF (DUF218 family)
MLEGKRSVIVGNFQEISPISSEPPLIGFLTGKPSLLSSVLRPRVSDGYDMLEGMNVKYPEEADLLEIFLKDLKIPEKAFIRDDTYVENTFDEAVRVKKEVERRGYKTLIIITSPTHSRRAWRTYKKVFEGTDVRIFSLPSSYSNYNPETYWHERKYLKDVILEYQKLLFYVLKYGI